MIVDLPFKNGDVHSYISLPEGISWKILQKTWMMTTMDTSKYIRTVDEKIMKFIWDGIITLTKYDKLVYSIFGYDGIW